MTNVLRFAKINHFLGDVRGVIADAFETLGCDKQMQTPLNVIRALLHVLSYLRLNLFVKRVDLFVARNDSPCCCGIFMHERIESGFQQCQHQRRHLRQIQLQLERRLFAQIARALGDLGRLVADAFEILRQLHRDGHESQFAGEWSFGEKIDGHLVHVQLEAIQHFVVRIDGEREVEIAIDERAHGVAHGFLGVTRHQKQFLF